MEIVAAIGIILGILVAFFDLRNHLQKPENVQVFRVLINSGAILLLIGFGAYFFYFGPKSIGDKFVEMYRFGDLSGVQRIVCQDSELQNQLSTAGAFMNLAQLLIGDVSLMTIQGQTFVPLANTYSFTSQPNSGFSNNNQPIYYTTLHIKPIGITEFCVSSAEERT